MKYLQYEGFPVTLSSAQVVPLELSLMFPKLIPPVPLID
jgi:hypothetical protein